jgi:Fe-S-cluster containining protein
MEKNNIDRKFREIHCGRCGTCCTEPVVPVTMSDVARLCKALKVEPQKFVRFYTMDEMAFDPESEVWIKFKTGKMAMGLKKRAARCMFLSSTISCKVYAHRPMTCRTFPYMIEFDDEGNPDRVRKNDIVDCKSTRKGLSHLDQTVSNVRIELNEDEAYYAKIREWNSLENIGDKTDFFKFMGLI